MENKITIDNNSPISLEIESNTKLDVLVKENISSKLIIISDSDYELNINLENNSSLIVNSLNKDNSVNTNITLLENSNITYNHSVLANKDSINNIKVTHLNSSSNSIVNNNGINRNNNKLFFTIDGVIPKELKNIICNQSSKIINFNKGNSKIIPNLIIDSNDIIANHAAYIGEIGEEELFYMQSRGISKENIKKLVYKAILLGKMDMDKEKEVFNKKVIEWW